jgi:hypothetical protein
MLRVATAGSTRAAARSLGRLVWPLLFLLILGPSHSARADDRASAQAIVAELEGDPARATSVAEALGQARDAIERGTRMRASGDEAHAKAADGLALEWAETARDVARAVDVEKTAADLRRKVIAEQAQIQRARALIEEGIVRVGRLRKELEDSSARVRSPRDAVEGRTAVEVHEGDPRRPSKSPQGTRAASPGVGSKP